jgi:hypothetical protein
MTKCNASEDGQHMFEASTTVYLDLDKFHITDDGTVVIDYMSPSHVNDQFDGVSLDLEANFTVTCASCGEHFAYDFSDAARSHIGLQPIGDAPRTLGERGGLNG